MDNRLKDINRAGHGRSRSHATPAPVKEIEEISATKGHPIGIGRARLITAAALDINRAGHGRSRSHATPAPVKEIEEISATKGHPIGIGRARLITAAALDINRAGHGRSRSHATPAPVKEIEEISATKGHPIGIGRARLITAAALDINRAGHGRSRSHATPAPVKEIEEISATKGHPIGIGRARLITAAAAGPSPNSGVTRDRCITYGNLVPPLETHTKYGDSKQGIHGRTVTLTTNCFKVERQTMPALHQYRVDFTPDEDRTFIRKGLLGSIKDKITPYLFDGTVLYTPTKLSGDLLEYLVDRRHGEEKIKITIKKVDDLVQGDPHYITVMNIIIKKCTEQLKYTRIRRNYYDTESKVVIDKYKLEIWPGYSATCRQHEDDVFLRTDLLFKVLRRNTALDLLNELMSVSPDNWQELFQKSLIGCVVLTSYNNRTYRVDDVDFEQTPSSSFNQKNERSITFIDFYKNKYGLDIRYTRQPLLVSLPKARNIRSGNDKLILLVPEFCVMTGITDEMRNNFHLMKSIGEFTRLDPVNRIQKTKKFMNKLLSNTIVKQELSLWNIKVNEMVECCGRLLPSEIIYHGNGQTSQVSANGDFTRNLRNQPLFHVNRLDDWIIIYPRKMNADVGIFINSLKRATSGMGFHIPPPTSEEIMDDRTASYIQAIERIVSKSRMVQLFLCVVPNNRKDRYDAIKKKCCIDRPVPSQVVLARNLNPRGAMSIATKIGIQISCKIGGVPWYVQIPFKKPIMVVGFDVSRDLMMKGRSFGALAASIDGCYSRYFTAVSTHLTGEELSNDISINLVKAAIQFRNNIGFLPPKIIVYRDGVGEGNVHYVLDHEVKSIEAKLNDLYMGEQVQIAYVLVNKKNCTRLFLDNGNPPPGTVVDSCVTNPSKYDFFLVSQTVKTGTVTPVYYEVIHDTTGLSPDVMQRLTYKLTMLYFNWSGTLSVPAPLQYAHKLAWLCSEHLHRQPSDDLNSLLYFL